MVAAAILLPTIAISHAATAGHTNNVDEQNGPNNDHQDQNDQHEHTDANDGTVGEVDNDSVEDVTETS